MEPIGLGLGILIGIITGSVFIIALRFAVARGATVHTVFGVIISQILALPLFWFGSPWLASNVLQGFQPASYVVSLALVFTSLIGWVLMALILRAARDISLGS